MATDMTVGVVSDTHIPARARELPASLLQALAPCELILHAGDILQEAVLDRLARIAPVRAVHGNVDPPDLADTLPLKRVLNLNGHVIGLTHGHGGKPGQTPARALEILQDDGCECVVFGHSHQPLVTVVNTTLLVNPGSPTDKRRELDPTFAVLEIGEHIEAQLYRITQDERVLPVEGMYRSLEECRKV